MEFEVGEPADFIRVETPEAELSLFGSLFNVQKLSLVPTSRFCNKSRFLLTKLILSNYYFFI